MSTRMYAILGSETDWEPSFGQGQKVRTRLKDGVPNVVAPVTARDDVSNQVGHGPGQKNKQKTSKAKRMAQGSWRCSSNCFRVAKLIKA